MRKFIDGKVLDTDKMETIATRVCARSYSYDPIGWDYVMKEREIYYLVTVGGRDFYAPKDDIVKIGDVEALEAWLGSEEGEPWRMDNDILDELIEARASRGK